MLAGLVVAGASDRRPAALFAWLGLFSLVDALGDVATAFLDPRDLPLLRTLPIAPRQYASARLRALALPIGVKALALGLATIAALVAQGELQKAAAFVAAFAAMASALAASAVLLLIAVRRLAQGWRPHVALAWLRAITLVAATGGALLLVRSPPETAASGGHFDAAALPSAWFAELHAALLGTDAIRWGRVAAALCWLAAATLAIGALARDYLALLEELERSRAPRATRAPAWRRAFERVFVAAGERPGFRLGLALLRRERTFRWQTLPLLGYPLLFLVLGRRAEDGGLFALLFAQLPALVLALAAVFLRFSDSPRGGFTLRFHGGGSVAAIQAGARKALWYAVALPLSAVVAALLAWDRGPLFGAAVGLTGLLSSTLAVVGLRAPSHELPFAEPFRGRVEGSEGGRVFTLLIVVLAAAAVEWRLLRAGSAATGALAAAALVAAAVVLRRRPPACSSPATWSAVEEVVAAPPAGGLSFAPRLRRELRRLALFFALAGLALTAFFAWI